MIRFIYRDTTLPIHILGLYYRGQKLFEPGFTDATILKTRPNGNVRFSIMSKRCKDVRSASKNAQRWGMSMIDKGSVYGVLDVFNIGGVTQILLTTEPYDSYEDTIRAARIDLRDSVSLPETTAVLDSEWYDRVRKPLGVNDEGELFKIYE